MTPQLGIYNLVEDVLRDVKETRNDDRLLVWLVYKRLGLVIEERVGLFKTESYMTWESFKEAPPVETITRARRRAQEEHQDLSPNWEIIQVRQEIAKEIDKMKPLAY